MANFTLRGIDVDFTVNHLVSRVNHESIRGPGHFEDILFHKFGRGAIPENCRNSLVSVQNFSVFADAQDSCQGRIG